MGTYFHKIEGKNFENGVTDESYVEIDVDTTVIPNV